jgi:DNA-binding NarL/FixJ family response regulator
MRATPVCGQPDPVNPLRCVIIDDDPFFLEAARILLEADGLTVAGTASTRADAIRQVDALHPDLALIDIRLGQDSGFNVARELAEGGTRAVLVMISTYAEDDYADLLAESPVIGFLPKAELSGKAIRRILGQV